MSERDEVPSRLPRAMLAAEVIQEIENPPMPPIVGEDFGFFQLGLFLLLSDFHFQIFSPCIEYLLQTL